ncbi:MAG TPA: SDR family oxidoreductase [Candidatus Cybelea sp.]|nr:SDR family oxidoreductase [Candidatus Cybelea sp.]
MSTFLRSVLHRSLAGWRVGGRESAGRPDGAGGGSDSRASNVLVLGGAGYLGSVLVPGLLARGFRVRIFDSFLFGEESLRDVRFHSRCELVRGDVRDRKELLRAALGFDSVIHLAGIVGDGACEENKQLATEINCAATRMLAESAPRCGIRRLLFASSCSVYGSSGGRLSEDSLLNPLSVYAQSKIESEKALLAARTKEFAPTVLRLGTLFGISARMRFDLVVNLLVARAVSSGRITICNGHSWRPLLHVRDAARAFLACLEAETDLVSGQVFNTGSNFLNLQIKDLGDIVASLIPGTKVAVIENKADRRTYRVSFDKIRRTLGFACRESVESGVREISAAIRSGDIIDFGRWDSAEARFNNQLAMRMLAAAAAGNALA